MHKRELWVYAKFLDDSGSKKTVAGGLTYLPVTLLRPSFSEVTDPCADALPLNSAP